MKSKILVAIVAVVLVAAAVGAFVAFSGSKEKDNGLTLLSGINAEGSGIYIKSSIDPATLVEDGSKPINPQNWNGLVFGTPGITSIQHTQLKSIVEGFGYSFVQYTDGAAAPKTVYYNAQIPNAPLALGTAGLDGGIAWQPQFEKIISDSSGKFKELALTNDLFPGHTCCVLAASHAYLTGHGDVAERLLASIVEATDWINAALDNPSGSDYKRLVDIGRRIAGADNFTEEQMKAALSTVKYFYGDDAAYPLNGIKENVAALADELAKLKGLVNNTPKDLGFDTTAAFVDKLVDDSYLVKATSEGWAPGKDRASITVAVIDGDIHQLAVHVASDLKIFDKYNLDVKFAGATNGQIVVNTLMSGEAVFGLLGAPPLTVNVLNQELIKG
ncbi:MAG: hypothetical protein LBG62_04115 [Candidatus Methanoplasma sp.]|jgi:ABC-type nitrate/sulfonate/bicarbonate transport system substrate-binding protein|nr:hypothetical protein [Candidatus Methanoplasma sp.]